MQIRNNCIICNSELKFLYTFKYFPMYMGISDKEDSANDMYSDMTWTICKSCGCVQLKELIDLLILYHRGHNSAYGKTWEEHHKRLAKFIKKYCGSSILELGGNNLKLAELVTENNDIRFTVYDNNCGETDKKNIITKEEFFDYNNYNLDYDIDTIVHSHVLEHLYDPIEYMNTFSRMLKNGQKLIMSVPLLDEMVKSKFTNGINFEHTYMLSEQLLYFMINKTGFRVLETKRFNPYNIFIACEKTPNPDIVVLENEYGKNITIFNEFVEFHNTFINNVNQMEGNDFYVFGGHIFSQYLFAFGLDGSKFICVLDNDPNKIGRRLYGTNLMVKSPKILLDMKYPKVVLRAAQFSDEIKKDILTNINNKTYFIER